jgi:two-component sensor histidine kinase
MAISQENIQQLLIREKTAKNICSELNNFVELKPTLITIIESIKELTGCEAVSIRLHDDGDYPYYVYDGFPESFIMQENSLCSKDEKGERILSPDGNGYLLECMCGNIIRGRFDPSLPFFTTKGSFWSNNTTELLDSTTEDDRQSRTRNVCNASGYESVALIPIKAHDERIGLIQINDRRPGMFTEELIEYCEMIGEQIGISIQNSLIYDKLQQSHEEIELLYREINHRVKNNLSTIMSFLSLQIQNIKDDRAKEALMESRNRVRTITRLHESIYRAKDIRGLNMKGYLLSIAGELIDLFQLDSKNITLTHQLDDFTLDIDRAIALGILVNEIITNSLKHAFTERYEGEINITSRIEDNLFTLHIRDNGSGMPNIDLESTESLGLQIVKSISKQLEGNITAINDSGTKFTITFPLKEEAVN